jgi:hypothetical protein
MLIETSALAADEASDEGREDGLVADEIPEPVVADRGDDVLSAAKSPASPVELAEAGLGPDSNGSTPMRVCPLSVSGRRGTRSRP